MAGFGSRIRKQFESSRPTPSTSTNAQPKNIRNLTRLSTPSASGLLGSTSRAPVPVNTPSLRKENGGQDATVSLIKGKGWGEADADDATSSAINNTSSAANVVENPTPADADKNVPWAMHTPVVAPPQREVKRWADEEESDDEDFPKIGSSPPIMEPPSDRASSTNSGDRGSSMSDRYPPRRDYDDRYTTRRYNDHYDSHRDRYRDDYHEGGYNSSNRPRNEFGYGSDHRYNDRSTRYSYEKRGGYTNDYHGGYSNERDHRGYTNERDHRGYNREERPYRHEGGDRERSYREGGGDYRGSYRGEQQRYEQPTHRHSYAGRQAERYDDGEGRWGFAKRSSHFESRDYARYEDGGGRYEDRPRYERGERGDGEYDGRRRVEDGPRVHRQPSGDLSPHAENEASPRRGSGGLSEARGQPGAARSTAPPPRNETQTPMVLLQKSAAGTAATSQPSGEESNEKDVALNKLERGSSNNNGTAWAPTPPVVPVSLADTVGGQGQQLPPVDERRVADPLESDVRAPLPPTPEKSPEELAAEQQQKILQQVADRRAAATTRKLWTDPDKPGKSSDEKPSQKKLLDRKSSMDRSSDKSEKSPEKPERKERKERPNPCRIEGHDHDWKDCPRNSRSDNYNPNAREEERERVMAEKPNPCKIEGHDHDWKDCPHNPRSENFERNNPCRIEGHDHDWNDCPSNPKSDNFGKWPKGERRRVAKERKERKLKKNKEKDDDDEKNAEEKNADATGGDSDSESSRKKPDRKKRVRESRRESMKERREKKAKGKSDKSEENEGAEEGKQTAPTENVEEKKTPAAVEEAKTAAPKPFVPAPPPAISAWKSGPPSAVKDAMTPASVETPSSPPRGASPSTPAATPARDIPAHVPSVQPKEQPSATEPAPVPVPAPAPPAQGSAQPTPPTPFVSNILPNPGPTALFPGNSALFGDSQGTTAVYGSWNPPPMVLPNTFVDPWKPNPFAPTTPVPAPAMGAQFGSIWSSSAAPAPQNNNSKPNTNDVETHRPLYAANTTTPAAQKEDAAVSELPVGNLSINDEKSAEKSGENGAEETTDANGQVTGSRAPYQGKKGGRFSGRGGRGRGGRFGRGGRGRGREGRSSRSETPTNEQSGEGKVDDSNTTGKPTALGEDKRSGRGRGSGRGSKPGRGKFKKGKDKGAKNGSETPAAAAAPETAT